MSSSESTESVEEVSEPDASSNRSEEKLKAIFKLIDTNNDGFIDGEETKQLVKKLQMESIDDFMEDADLNADGKVSFEEFKQMVKVLSENDDRQQGTSQQ